MLKYPKKYNEFINVCKRSSDFFKVYEKLGSPRPFDVSLRDGLQGLTKTEQEWFTLDNKKLFLDKIINEQNPQSIEVSSIVSPKILPIFKDAKELFQYTITQVPGHTPNISPFLLIPNVQNLDSILLDTTIQCNHFSFITSISNSFQYKNTKKTIEETRIEVKKMLEQVKVKGRPTNTTDETKTNIKLYISCINECPLEGKKDNDFIINEIMKYNHEQINTICLSDTMGTLEPSDFEYIVDNCNKNGLPFSKLSLHLHVKKERKYIAEILFHKALDRNIIQFDVSAIESGGCSVTMEKSKLNPNLTYELYYEFLTNYILKYFYFIK